MRRLSGLFARTLMRASLLSALLATATAMFDLQARSIDLVPPGEQTVKAPALDRTLPIDKQWNALVDSYFNDMFRLMPTWATSCGVHTYDCELESMSAAYEQNKGEALASYLKAFSSFDDKSLTPYEQHDRQIVISQIKGALLSLKDLQWWKRNPDEYSSRASEAIFGLAKRHFAPLDERLRSVIARENKIPALLANAKKNLDPALIPRVSAEIALEQLPDIISFFENSVPEAFLNVHDTELQSELQMSTNKVVESLKDYKTFLQHDLLDAGLCRGTIAIGEENFRKKLLYDEMVDESVESLLARGEAELARLQKEFKDVAHSIAPGQSESECFEAIAKNHPAPSALVKDVSDLLEKIRNFCLNKDIVSIPSQARPIVEETPAFMRALTFASLDAPGMLEQKATETFYNVTLPDPNWTAEKTEEHMRSFSYPDLLNTSVHEAYPGHFVQFLFVKEAPSKIRKLLGCGSNDEGWAHYCEQMMLDEGFEKGDQQLRLVQLHDALLRACRYIVGIRMHCRNMSLEESVAFFMTQGFMERTNAEREAKRGTSDPTYLVYTLGKLEILKLRQDYKTEKGDKFSLKEFHDRFMSAGYPPLKIVRAEMLNQPYTP